MLKHKSTRLAALFDIRLSNTDHDVLVLKGSEHTAASTLLSGKIVLSVTEPMTVRKMTLRLYSTLRILGADAARNTVPKPVRFEKKLYEYVWEPSEITKYLNNMYENSTRMALRGSLASLKNLGLLLRLKSSNSLQHLHQSLLSQSPLSLSLAGKNGHLLVSGNYEFPFSAILPGNMPESVEGLPGALVVYKMEATIDRGKFHTPMVCKKKIRVIRTMTTDSVELSETVAVDNTWPNKVEYLLSVPSKAIAIGSGTVVSMMLVPLLKGLVLGDISIELVEMYLYVGYVPPLAQQERVVCEKKIKRQDNDTGLDRWEIETFLQVPPLLLRCTQDCDIQTHLKVRHKLKFAIGLCNPDGHTSELRALLPVQLFISPFVSISARPHETEEEEVLFSDNEVSGTLLPFLGMVAPPVYEKHVYDQLWLDVLPMESPVALGSATPRWAAMGPGSVADFSMASIDTAQLTENLRQLSIQRQLEDTTPLAALSLRNATFNLDGDSSSVEGDYFTKGRPIGPALGMLLPPLHLLRAGLLENVHLLRVPSYNEAIRQGVQDSLAPLYKPPLPGLHINLAEAYRRLEPHTPIPSPRNRLFLLRSKNSSAGSLPSALSTNLAGMNEAFKRMTRTGTATFSMTPRE